MYEVSLQKLLKTHSWDVFFLNKHTFNHQRKSPDQINSNDLQKNL